MGVRGAAALWIGLWAVGCDDGGAGAEPGGEAGAPDRGVLTDATPVDMAPPPVDVAPPPPVDAAPADAAPPCAPGAARCADRSTAEVCDADGAWQSAPCGMGEACSAGVCACVEGASLGCADGAALLLCGADGPVREDCPRGQLCRDGVCGAVACASDNACDSDTWCLEGTCTPYPGSPRGDRNPGCRLPFALGDFSPAVQCRWESGQVSMQPIAIDLDGDAVPEILFVAGGTLIAVRGDDCTEVARSQQVLLSGESALAAGDIDADGKVEVVALGGTGITVFDETLGFQWGAVAPPVGLAGAPAIADLDGDGMPEVVIGGLALNGEDGSVHGRAAVEPPSHGFGPIPAIADVDGDGRQEVLYGNRMYDAEMNDITPPLMQALRPGHVAVADFDPLTPEPEIAVVSGTTQVRVQRLDGELIFGPYQVPESMWAGGAPNVADFDGDGRPEIGTAGSSMYAVFDLDCVAEPLPEGCAAEGIRWLKVTRDTSSGSTGSTTFDFEGDGKVEVVYNDECFLRVYDGTTGDVLLALANTTGTLIEAPIVLDVDGDFNSEIVVGSDRGFACPDPDPDTGTPPRQTNGITVLRDVTDRWVHSRPIWNQNAYSITNVENDGTIPRRPEPNWERFNSFRQNAEPEDKALEAPDLTVGGDGAGAREGCGAPVTLEATVFNRGTQPISRGVKVGFFDRPPRDEGAVLLCEGRTMQRLAPGDSERVACFWNGAGEGRTTVHVEADLTLDGGEVVEGNAECAEGNNGSTFIVPACR